MQQKTFCSAALYTLLAKGLVLLVATTAST
jgi:hypothetical protein